jgi:Zn-dependent alcohol dehydrogenase
MGHEYCGIVEEVGREVRSIKPGHIVIPSFFASDINTCANGADRSALPHRRANYVDRTCWGVLQGD